MDNQAFEMLNDRMERIETKLDDLLEHKWVWTGRMSVVTFLGSIIVSFFISKIYK